MELPGLVAIQASLSTASLPTEDECPNDDNCEDEPNSTSDAVPNYRLLVSEEEGEDSVAASELGTTVAGVLDMLLVLFKFKVMYVVKRCQCTGAYGPHRLSRLTGECAWR